MDYCRRYSRLTFPSQVLDQQPLRLAPLVVLLLVQVLLGHRNLDQVRDSLQLTVIDATKRLTNLKALGFGSAAQPNSFSSPPAAAGGFGQPSVLGGGIASSPSPFGGAPAAPSPATFGASSTTGFGGGFGNANPGGGFGALAQTAAAPGGFGSLANASSPQPGFGQPSPFGSPGFGGGPRR